MSTVFSWDQKDFNDLLRSCEKDDVLPLIKKYFPKGGRILESGCGLGRWVKYLQDRGWNVTGLEISKEAVKAAGKIKPKLKIVEGDAENSPFKENFFDGVLSLGVVEHWPEGPQPPLRDIYRILKPGGVAIVTAPCLNTVRRLKRFLLWYEIRSNPRVILEWLFKSSQRANRFKKEFRYFVYPAYGDFFEYRFTPREFGEELRKVGFEIIEHSPSATIDGLYHELNLGGKLVKFERWEFETTLVGRFLNDLLSKLPFFHAHMQVAVVCKPIGSKQT